MKSVEFQCLANPENRVAFLIRRALDLHDCLSPIISCMNMPHIDRNADPQTFSGSTKVGMFTAQLLVKLSIDSDRAVLRASGRSFIIDRSNLLGIEETSILRIFKRGIKFVHCQPDLPATFIFYPSMGLVRFRSELRALGWEPQPRDGSE